MVLAKDELYHYWGKANRSDANAPPVSHLLPYHCLDVAAVAAYWWDHAPALRKSFSQKENQAEYRGWLLFFIALHDLGKWDIRFQAKCWRAWEALNSVTSGKNVIGKTWDHGQGGLYWFKQDFDQDSDYDGAFITHSLHPKEKWFPWVEAVTGHHGYIYQHINLTTSDLALSVQLKLQGERDKKARLAWLDALAVLFLHPVGLSLDDNPPSCSSLLAGFCSISDWLGSWNSEETFQFQSTPEPLHDYYLRRYAVDAPVVMKRSGLLSKINPWGGTAALLNKGYKPRQLQTLVEALPDEPGLIIIEAPTGSGKTETALAYAWRLLASGYADSIIFALPTQATANAMLNRLEKLASTLFDKPNLILAHGNSRFSSDFNAIKSRSKSVQEQEAWAQCCEWLSRSNKRAFLGQIGVCTIDQVLISVLPVKHRFIRGFGVARSVLLVDEVHAYDTYMHSLLEEVLRQQAMAGQSALLLSATLPPSLKQRLLKTYGHSATTSPSDEYPLVIWQQQDLQRCFDLSAAPEHLPPVVQLNIECCYLNEMQPDAGLLEQMIAAAQAGAQVCLICNLVDVAQQVYQRLCASTALEIILFHSRFTLTDRATKEELTLRYFGASGDRSIGRILVGTQVVEQSLDVDFDWLITQLCPVDLLFQRAGRLHRHSRQCRPEGYQQPKLTVLLPASHDYGNSNYVYTNTRAMWRTQQLLEQQGQSALCFPQAYRLWIDHVYRDETDESEPDWVAEGLARFESQEQSKRYNARLSLNQATRVTPFADDDVRIRAVTRDGEMSLPVVPYVETARGKQLCDRQYLSQLSEFSLPEALALNRVNVPGSWQRRYRLEPDEEGMVWIAGTLKNGQWTAEMVDYYLVYSKEVGMSLIQFNFQGGI
ncbi:MULTISPECIES: CRISPR-associated helicase/endonuclease Cas3 [unclassified Pantoea]|uniref:CRISPR-associated helicase/endonuclease Cas3 n=1 Tax=unclassified Pantoea TaxID=2630326 RepID=UPI00226A136B|nr:MULTISPECIES: CRISPR-associated helicase/endonuclease Cas3 [unclassified Pantoea]